MSLCCPRAVPLSAVPGQATTEPASLEECHHQKSLERSHPSPEFNNQGQEGSDRWSDYPKVTQRQGRLRTRSPLDVMRVPLVSPYALPQFGCYARRGDWACLGPALGVLSPGLCTMSHLKGPAVPSQLSSSGAEPQNGSQFARQHLSSSFTLPLPSPLHVMLPDAKRAQPGIALPPSLCTCSRCLGLVVVVRELLKATVCIACVVGRTGEAYRYRQR